MNLGFTEINCNKKHYSSKIGIVSNLELRNNYFTFEFGENKQKITVYNTWAGFIQNGLLVKINFDENTIEGFKDLEKIGLYIQEVTSQLTCNSTDEYQSTHITYTYSNEQVYANLEYFEKCMNAGLSADKSLLFFHDYLNGEYVF